MADVDTGTAAADAGGDIASGQAPPPAAEGSDNSDSQYDLSVFQDADWDAAQSADAEGGEEAGEDQTTLSADGDAEAGDTDAGDSDQPDAKSILDAADSEESDGEPAKPSEWTSLREQTIARVLKDLEGPLSKRVTAADLPKELAKRKTALSNALGRYATLQDALIAGINAQERIRSGQVRQPLPENASAAERAAWREANGIPEEATGYNIAKSPIPGYEWTENDQPVLDSFREAAHQANMTQDQVNAAARWFAARQQEARQEMQEAQSQIDRQDTQTTRQVLRERLEGDFTPSLTLMDRYLKDGDVFPDGIGEAIISARTGDGHRLINNPAIASWLIESARSHYGEGAMITGQAAEALSSEYDELTKLMNTDIQEFQQGKWKATGVSASERMLEIDRQRSSRGRRAA